MLSGGRERMHWELVDLHFRNSFNGKPTKITNKKKLYYNPINALISFVEPIKVKHLKHFPFVDMGFFFTWFNL